MSSRYFFNLANGEDMIPGEDGIELSDIHLSCSSEWQGWRLEIIDYSGQLVQSILLDDPLWKNPSQH
jgi:hypothetical protein